MAAITLKSIFQRFLREKMSKKYENSLNYGKNHRFTKVAVRKSLKIAPKSLAHISWQFDEISHENPI